VKHEDSAATVYEREWQAAEAAKEAGRLEEAYERYVAAFAAAELLGDHELVDRAFCNRAALGIALGRDEDPVPRLCTILMRNRSRSISFLAANTVARACELRRDYPKGLFYARIARDHAEAVARPEWLATASNQIGNLLLAESYFEDAAASYRQALALIADGGSPRQLVFEANLGYCELVLGRHKSGLALLYRCLRAALRRDWERIEMIARIDLCYAHLEMRRYRDAERYGARGLALAEEIGEVDLIKNALYLSGQVAVLLDDEARGREIFAELQRRFYPGQPFLADLLVNVDVRPLINLRA